MLHVPEPSLAYGFANGPGGTHTSRTMMLAELELLLAACPPVATYQDYQAAVIEDNVLLKRTGTTRRRSLRALRELYALDGRNTLFRALRQLWFVDEAAHPSLALLSAVARDPLLRATAYVLLDTPPGDAVTPQELAAAVTQAFPDRYRASTAAKIGRNAASSWRQSGHLVGKFTKTRVHPECRPAGVAYALFLGYLCGGRGDALLDSFWCRLLDAPAHVLHDHAFAASQQGWVDYRHTGMVTEITFQHLMPEGG